MQTQKMRASAMAVLVLAALQGATAVQAQAAYPSKTITIVVGFAAGGSTDLLARAMAREFTDEFKQPVIVDNRPGANSNLAASFVARAQPDGYTLLMVPFGLAVNEFLYKNLSYGLKSFEPIALVAKVPNVIVVNKDLPVHSVREFVDYAKAHPTEITYASPGVGSSLHLAGELFRYETQAPMLHVPFNGSGPALIAVRGGEVKSAFDNLSTAAAFIKSGDLRALAVTSEKRSPAFPDIPTVAESGFPRYEISSYFGLGAPAGTPPEIVDKLNRAAMKALERPAVKAQLALIGAVTEPNRPEDFRRFLQQENGKWREVIKTSNITPN